jgi:NADH-quinone oxidoreductase subunit L
VSLGLEWLLVLVSVGIAALGIGIAYRFYKGPEAFARPRQLAERFSLAYKLILNKYWVDEIYDAVIVRPIRMVSDGVLWRIVDVRIIDGIVNALGGLTKAFSYVFRFAQSGYVQTYVLVVVLGVLFLLVRAL